MKNKKGQFYIVAAIIIIIVIASLTSIVTYTLVKPEPKTIQDLSSELKEESAKIIDFGIYNGVNLTSLLENFTEEDISDYIYQKAKGANITFIYGNKEDLYRVDYSKRNIGEIGIGSIGINSYKKYKTKSKITISSNEDELNVNILDREFKFKLRDNEMFYFVIVKEKEGEVFIERN